MTAAGGVGVAAGGGGGLGGIGVGAGVANLATVTFVVVHPDAANKPVTAMAIAAIALLMGSSLAPL